MITVEQEKRLAEYKKILLADIDENMPDEAFAVFCKIKGYLQALSDLGQIAEQEMQALIKEYTL